MDNYQIVASVLIRNENIYIERVILNILDFCEKIIITDHQSTDGTYQICQKLADKFSKIELISIKTLGESFQVLKPYCSTKTWIFAVDGDEIFDTNGLKEMRARLLKGDFSEEWNIYPNTLHCTKLDLEANKGWGYLAPPARAGARLYNFSIINDWRDYGERLLGDNIRFKDGYHIGMRKFLYKELEWDDSYFRYVHTSFLPRSTMDKGRFKTRLNADELHRINNQKSLLRKLYLRFKTHFMHLLGMDWKNQKYRKGPIVEKDIKVFFE